MRPTLPTLEAVCKAFGITLAQFFSEGNGPAEMTEEQRALFGKMEYLNRGAERSAVPFNEYHVNDEKPAGVGKPAGRFMLLSKHFS